ncbi:pyrophosphate--fructose 6-phosphate 1-phosphotransferase subunit alpha-like [Musa acuminata AAA Group]|uniref:pyrophosphate--fructose 6-phosphate 1-phosphotransferase subunit alpha-like n=1 Tax=Musa acuminata AAA Group TaxID=214697 RepID=UPI0031D788FE
MEFGAGIEFSTLQKQRSLYVPQLPPCLQGSHVQVEFGDATTVPDPLDAESIKRSFPLTYGQPLVHFVSSLEKPPPNGVQDQQPPLRVGVVFCGRQSPGGHNIICGLYDAMKLHNPKSTLLGFCGGTEGLFVQKTLVISDDIVAAYRNQGGYDMLGRTKDQITSKEQVNSALNACQTLDLNGLVVIGGVTSNTDAAQLAETFAEAKCLTKVVGVPVTFYGDLQNQFVEANVGFDTICKVNSQLISNICTDALSAEKYYYFIRLMGRSASHVTLECSLQSHPNMVILGEEVASSKLTLHDITKRICNAVQSRAEKGKYHGVILLPEGLVESIPEVYALLQEIHVLLKNGVSTESISGQLSPWASALFESMPPFIKKQLLLSPESDQSAQLSQIETEKLLAQLVETEMEIQTKNGTYTGKKFNSICHFFGYQARGSVPSNFDCDYAYALGHGAYHLLAAGLNGYIATVTNLKNDVSRWRCGGAPLTAMMTIRRLLRGLGTPLIGKPSIHPVGVDLKGKSYGLLLQNAEKYLMDDLYSNPGPIQYKGPGSDSKTICLCVEDHDYMGRLKKLQSYLDKVKTSVRPGCSQEVLKAAVSAMAYVVEILSLMSPAGTGHAYHPLEDTYANM